MHVEINLLDAVHLPGWERMHCSVGQCTVVHSSSKISTLNTILKKLYILMLRSSPNFHQTCWQDLLMVNIWWRSELRIKSSSPFSAVLSVPSKHHRKQSRNRYKQKRSPMLMQNSWKIIMQIKNEKKNNILHADGYNLMYHKLILLSMKRVKQRK